MEGNSSTDDEVQDSSHNTKLGGKKLKLNDGSSQDSLKEAESSSKQAIEENVDSGVSADKSESVSSDDRAAAASEGPSNEVVNAAPSTSNVRTILLNITRRRRSRNYRKRKTPGQDSDSNDSSRDSDDLSAAESPQASRPNQSNSDEDSDDMQRFIGYSEGSPSSTHMTTSDSNDTSYVTDDMVMQSGDTDSEDEWPRDQNENEGAAGEDSKEKLPAVLLKTRPKHQYSILREIINREMGLTFPLGKATKTDVIFEQKFYSSLHAVFRMQKLHSLSKHRGCVNCINFHPEGHLLASGSDDTNVVVWDWARNNALQTIKTGHKSNVFQSKFLYLNARSQLNIVTCARDGQVRLLQCPPSGGTSSRRRLAMHARAAHKLHVTPHEPHVVISAGEDGLVMQCDVRDDHANRLFHVKGRSISVPLYSVCGHPLDPKLLMVAGRDKFVRVYDRRKSSKPLASYCPTTFEDHQTNAKKRVRLSMMHLTCAVYSHDGSEILGSYNDDDVYLFDAKTDVYDKDNTVSQGYTHRYSGHRNSATFKGVSFFGPGSEYIVSGSDCSYIYIWEKRSESIVQWMQGDVNGVVNCIEAHPRCPVMATSGLDKDVKIWMPIAEQDPTFKGIERVVRENVASQLRSPLFNDFLPTIYSAWRGENRLLADIDSPPHSGGNIEFDGNVCTTF